MNTSRSKEPRHRGIAAGLRDQRDSDRWLEHVRTFFEDVPREAIFRFMLAHDVSAERLLAIYPSTLSR